MCTAAELVFGSCVQPAPSAEDLSLRTGVDGVVQPSGQVCRATAARNQVELQRGVVATLRDHRTENSLSTPRDQCRRTAARS